MSSNKLSITKINEALERASRVARSGDPDEQAGRFTDTAPATLREDPVTTDEMVVYNTQRGIRVTLKFEGDTLWLTQRQISELFGVTVTYISQRLRALFAEGELDKEAVMREQFITAPDGKTYPTQVYNLDAIISVGYRVSSRQATTFRMWATHVLVEYAKKGFALDDERLKEPAANDYFKELRDRIRDIRAAESNVYREIKEIVALCVDYDPTSQASRNFFAYTQNKLLWATTSMTAPELLVNRADATKPNMGLATWTKERIRQNDVVVAKNYLAEKEIKELNRITNMMLDFFVDKVERRERVAMSELEEALDRFLKFNERSVLRHAGSVSRASAEEHARAEYKKFAAIEREKRQAIE
jgi:hypothetical protein